MRIPWIKHIAAALMFLCLPLVVTGCGGGGGGGTGGGATLPVSGVAAKGPIVGGTVSVYQLLDTGARGALLGTGTTGTGGTYSVSIPATEAAKPVVVVVTGGPGATYTSETTGQPVPFSATESFSAAVPSFTAGVDVAVTPLTQVAFEKLPLILAEKPGALSQEKLQSSIVSANAQVGSLFGITDILAPPSGSSAYQATLMIVDQMVEDSKATGSITDTRAVLTLISQAVADVNTALPAYQAFLEVFTAAAATVQTANPGAVTVAVNAIVTQAAAPPAEPDFSDVTAPSTVTGLAATTTALTSTTSSVALTWTASTDNVRVAGYDVFRDGTKIATTVTASYTDAAVTSNVTYAYTVVAFDAAGNRSSASAALSVRPIAPPLDVTVSGQVVTN